MTTTPVFHLDPALFAAPRPPHSLLRDVAIVTAFTAALMVVGGCTGAPARQLCTVFPQWTIGQRACTSAVLAAHDHAIPPLPACTNVASEAQCRACVDAAALPTAVIADIEASCDRARADYETARHR